MVARLIALVVGTLILGMSAAADGPLTAEQIRKLTEARKMEAISLFRDYLSVPNDAHFPEKHIKPMIVWLKREFGKRGFEVSEIPTDGSPLLLAERPVAGAEKTVLVYLQADGQPVDHAAWYQENAYVPVLKTPDANAPGGFREIPWSSLEGEHNPDWRIFARAASDSKGPNIQFLAAMDNLKAAGVETDFNLKVIIDLEEELGSPNLAKAVIANREKLAADMLLIFDGPPHASGAPTVSFGARGIALVALTTYGPKVPQHSGHYGNYIPNPGHHLSRILASMKDIDGRVTIPGYYDGITVSDDVKQILAEVPDDEEAIRKQYGIKAADKVGETLQLSRQYPSLNFRGISSAWVGSQARTIVPATATAEIDIRLVKESDPVRLIGLVKKHVEDMGYTVLDHAPTDAERAAHARIVTMTSRIAYGAFRTDFDSAPGRMTVSALNGFYGHNPIRIRTSGGSIPISPFVETLNVPAVTVPTVNIDNNQHSPNENLRLGNFIEGISILTAVMAERLK